MCVGSAKSGTLHDGVVRLRVARGPLSRRMGGKSADTGLWGGFWEREGLLLDGRGNDEGIDVVIECRKQNINQLAAIA